MTYSALAPTVPVRLGRGMPRRRLFAGQFHDSFLPQLRSLADAFVQTRPISLCVVDYHGRQLVAISSYDAVADTVGVAANKCATAIMFGASESWALNTENKPELPNKSGLPGICTFRGSASILYGIDDPIEFTHFLGIVAVSGLAEADDEVEAQEFAALVGRSLRVFMNGRE